MKIVDLKLNIDGVILPDDEGIEEVIKRIRAVVNSNYDIQYEVLYEEKIST